MANEWRVPYEEFAANLSRIFERLRRTDETLLVETSDEVIVVRRSAADEAPPSAAFTPSTDDLEAFYSAAGSWSDVDTDALIADIYAGRERISDRPCRV